MSHQISEVNVAGIVEELRARGHRVTPQRRAIVAETLGTEGHIAPQAVAKKVSERVPGVNASTVYRTLELLEELGYVSHAHLEDGFQYHLVGQGGHVHLVCARCGRQEALPVDKTVPFKRLIEKHSGFSPDFSHFSISGLCAACRKLQDSR